MTIEFIRHTTWEYLCSEDCAGVAAFLGREISEEEYFMSQDLDDEIQRKLDAMSDADVLEIFYQQRNKAAAKQLRQHILVRLEEMMRRYEDDRLYFYGSNMKDIAEALDSVIELCEIKRAEICEEELE